MKGINTCVKAAVILSLISSPSCKKVATTPRIPISASQSPFFLDTDTTYSGNNQISQNSRYIYNHAVNVVNLGFPGFKATDLYAVENLVLKENPDLIILMCGTNEVLQNDYNDYKSKLGKLIDDLKSSTTEIMLLTPPPLSNSVQNSLITNIICPAVRSSAGDKKCYLADLNTAFDYVKNYNSLLLPDGIHPTATGYLVIARQILDVYVNNNMSKFKIVCFGDSITYGYLLNGAGTITGDTYPAQLSDLLNP